ncbi:MAG: hypothetical protein EPN82_14105 [Bacteroidetes bacterium]|nr:MAG: hypothetical protein EPN82_14105 [Bacteroidota bacterium]
MSFFIKRTAFILLIITLSFLVYSCRENSSNPIDENITYQDTGKKALLIVVENKDLIAFSDENMFRSYKEMILPVLSDLFGVPKDSMENLMLGEIVEQYGEPWQLNQIADAGKDYYDKIIKLTDETATSISFIDSLKILADEDYTIDVVLNLHGSMTSLVFTDTDIDFGTLTQRIKSKGIKIRALYQTACYGKYSLNSWSNIGLYAVNGAEDLNEITLFSAAYFIREWTSGKTYEDAVYSAYDFEIQKLKTYNNILPVDEFILTQENLMHSLQRVTGKDTKILWKNVPVNDVMF